MYDPRFYHCSPRVRGPGSRASWSAGDWEPDEDPVIVRRLKAAGAIVIGKTTMPEFAYCGYTHSPRWGVTRQPPHDPPADTRRLVRRVRLRGRDRLYTVGPRYGHGRFGSHSGGIMRRRRHEAQSGTHLVDILPIAFDNKSHFGPLASCLDDAALFLSVTQGPDDADILSQPRRDTIEVPSRLRGPRA